MTIGVLAGILGRLGKLSDSIKRRVCGLNSTTPPRTPPSACGSWRKTRTFSPSSVRKHGQSRDPRRPLAGHRRQGPCEAAVIHKVRQVDALFGLETPAAGQLDVAPGTWKTGGKGETGSLNLVVAKSGRTTGLTCASISALNLDVEVDYFKNCAETVAYLTKTFKNQIAIEGNEFSDAGDSANN